MERQRLDFIDLAKGICILLVVSIHLDWYNLIYFTPRLNNAFFAFRMPLYFVIAGLFLSFRGGQIADYKCFVEKKVNRLFVPLFFFTLLANIYNLFCYEIGLHSEFHYRATTYLMTNECFGGNGGWNNGPIFFVMWLFNAYMLVAVLNIITRGRLWLIVLLSLVVGLIGYNVQLPFCIDTAMTCCPFVVFGMVLKQKTNLITMNEMTNRKRAIYLFVSLILLVLLLVRSPAPNLFYCNRYGTTWPEIYLYGIMGTMAVLLFAKSVGKIPYVNYIGRYSIIVLGVHSMCISDTFSVVHHFICSSSKIKEAIVFFIVMVISTICVYVFKKYVPKLVAQDDLIKINW